MGKKKGRAKKASKLNNKLEDAEINKAPHTFVFPRGHVGSNVQQLAMDMRRVMEPFTASKLKVRKKNVLKDFVAVAGPLGVTHFISFSKTTSGVNMRLARLPKGPTLHFKVLKYSLSKDVVSSVKKPKTSQGQYRTAPLLVLNEFKTKDSKTTDINSVNPQKLCATMLQNMFPSINIHKVNLNHVQRCVLFNNVEDNRIEFRHYNIAVKPIGMSRRMKKIVTQRNIPNLGKLADISDYLTNRGDGSASESEPELDDQTSEVELPQKMVGAGNMKSHQSAIRLTELGPRLMLELFKIEEGMHEGEVLFHSFIEKTEEEKKLLEKSRQKKKSDKEMRKKQQEMNIQRKEDEKKKNKEKSIAGMKRKLKDEEQEDDDVQYYRDEVGAEPDEDLAPPKKVFRKMRPKNDKPKIKTVKFKSSKGNSQNFKKNFKTLSKNTNVKKFPSKKVKVGMKRNRK
uniref:Peter pan homolog (Drosophila) n=1 Tax=Ciona intestinalis TaxID=7719 RepID=F6Z910_CIOIN